MTDRYMTQGEYDRARAALEKAGIACYGFLAHRGWYIHILPGWEEFTALGQVRDYLKGRK